MVKLKSSLQKIAIMTWLNVTEYVYHRWQSRPSFLFMTFSHRIFNTSNTTNTTSWTEAAYIPGAIEFASSF